VSVSDPVLKHLSLLKEACFDHKEKVMKYFGISDKATYLTDKKYMQMAQSYWGAGPLPKGAKIIGGFSDSRRAGALIKFSNGNLGCGNAGVLSNVPQKREKL